MSRDSKPANCACTYPNPEDAALRHFRSGHASACPCHAEWLEKHPDEAQKPGDNSWRARAMNWQDEAEKPGTSTPAESAAVDNSWRKASSVWR